VESVVSLHGVTVRAGARTVLDGVSFSIPAGQRVAILGPSGAGKTTLMNVLVGAVTPFGSRVEVLGAALADLSRRELRRVRARIGAVHQDLGLIGQLSVIHNMNVVRLAEWSAMRSVWSLARPQGIAEASAALGRLGLAGRVHDRTDQLSGGERQRVAVARVLLRDPDLVVADEPVSDLDPQMGRRVLEELTAPHSSRRAAVVTLHDPKLAIAHCDRIVGLRAGRVVLDVPAEGLADSAVEALYRDAG
jgi:phosphonate transport system ATP-binding protein